jgi:hypothetical protein
MIVLWFEFCFDFFLFHSQSTRIYWLKKVFTWWYLRWSNRFIFYWRGGGGYVFIHTYSARLISFAISCIWINFNRELRHEYMNIHPSPPSPQHPWICFILCTYLIWTLVTSWRATATTFIWWLSTPSLNEYVASTNDTVISETRMWSVSHLLTFSRWISKNLKIFQ